MPRIWIEAMTTGTQSDGVDHIPPYTHVPPIFDMRTVQLSRSAAPLANLIPLSDHHRKDFV